MKHIDTEKWQQFRRELKEFQKELQELKRDIEEYRRRVSIPTPSSISEEDIIEDIPF